MFARRGTVSVHITDLEEKALWKQILVNADVGNAITRCTLYTLTFERVDKRSHLARYRIEIKRLQESRQRRYVRTQHVIAETKQKWHNNRKAIKRFPWAVALVEMLLGGTFSQWSHGSFGKGDKIGNPIYIGVVFLKACHITMTQ